MLVTEAARAAGDAITVKRLFAEPYDTEGLTVIAAAAVTGAAGGRSGTASQGRNLRAPASEPARDQREPTSSKTANCPGARPSSRTGSSRQRA